MILGHGLEHGHLRHLTSTTRLQCQPASWCAGCCGVPATGWCAGQSMDSSLQLILPTLLALHSLGTLLLLSLEFVQALLHLVVIPLPLVDDPLRHYNLRLLGQWVLAEIDCLGSRLGSLRAPSLAPEPVVWQREDGYLRLREVGQILVQVSE